MKKTRKRIFLASFLLVCMGILLVPNKSYSFLHGTYTCKEQPFSTMSFDYYGNTFSYYHSNEKTLQTEDKGNYSKQREGEYILQSGIFKDTHVTCEDNSFYINIGGGKYLFQRIGKLPTVLETTPQ